ncbi:MAG: hypothetical protein Q9191_005612 [Dirinaria sp. TL-2023a]
MGESGGGKPKITLPFILPKIRAKAVDVLDNKEAVDATLDYLKDNSEFSVEILAWAIQNGISVPCIERYVRKEPATSIEYELGVAVETKTLDPGYPILFFAVERNSPKLIKLLCSLGACSKQRALLSKLPVLAYAVISAENQVLDTTPTVIALLASGANPRDIPEEMWRDYRKSPARLQTTPATESIDPLAWCTLEVQNALCRSLNLMQRYSLWKAEKFPKPSPKREQLAKLHDATALFGIPFHIVGQHPAINDVLESITSQLLFENPKPLVLLFAGPSGHGKTELAMRMGELMSLESMSVDCTEMECETDLFGRKAPYRGYEEGSPLNNHLAKWAGQGSVVFLDEFDKTSKEVRQSLLLLFQCGDYRDRRDKKKLDCSKVIWILATNHGEETIGKFWVDHIEHRTEEQQRIALFKELHTRLKETFTPTIGAPLTGRVTYIVPFFPFTEGEQAVVVYRFLLQLANSVREPINIATKKLAGHLHLNFVDDGKICSSLAKDFYMPELGARSLETAVDCQVKARFSTEFLSQSQPVTDEMNEAPLSKYDVCVSTTSSGNDEVTVKQSGFTKLQSRKGHGTGGANSTL